MLDEQAHKDMGLGVRSALAQYAQLLSPNVSFCQRCGLPWTVVSSHSTQYDGQRGCFPLCVLCWDALTVDERMPYYHRLWESWDTEDDPPWHMIQAAVLNEGNDDGNG